MTDEEKEDFAKQFVEFHNLTVRKIEEELNRVAFQDVFRFKVLEIEYINLKPHKAKIGTVDVFSNSTHLLCDLDLTNLGY